MLRLQNRIYVITDEKLLRRADYLSRISEAAQAGAGIIQLREKSSMIRDRLALAREAVKTAHMHQARLIINDDPLLAKVIGADGVHLGKDDASVENARALLGQKAIIGVSCYDDIDSAVLAEKAGADYVSFGACFRSPTKPKEPLVRLSLFGQAKQRLNIPLVAIGGIDIHNMDLPLSAGADMISVVSAVFARKDTLNVVKKLCKIQEKYNDITRTTYSSR